LSWKISALNVPSEVSNVAVGFAMAESYHRSRAAWARGVLFSCA
jgi:hypothetical protein